MPSRNLQSSGRVTDIPFSKGKTTTYSDPEAEIEGKRIKGIRLAVSANVKTWIHTGRVNGGLKTTVIGAHPTIPTIFQAKAALDDMSSGIGQKSSAKGSGVETLNDALEQVLSKSSASDRTKGEYRSNVRLHLSRRNNPDATSDLFDMPVDEIALSDIEDALEPHVVVIDGIRHSREIRFKLKQIIAMAFKRAAAQRRVFDPCPGIKIEQKVPTRAINIDELKLALDLIDELKTRPRSVLSAYGWEIMTFTGLRSKNVKQMRWADIDLDEGVLRVERAKRSRNLKFPLSQHVVSILRELHRMTGNGEYVFPAQRSTSSSPHPQSFGRTLGSLTPHMMRHLFTTAGRRAGIDEAKVDKMRGVQGRGMVAHYDQGSLTHADFEKLSREMLRMCGRNPDAKVVRLKAVN